MGAPQWIMLGLYGISIWTHFAKHGQARTGVYNFDQACAATLVSAGLLYWGGFFS
jgi:hypothetical protein